MKAGFRSNNLDPERAPLHGLGGGGLHAHLRHGRADGLLRRHRGRRRLRALGLEHGGDAPDPVDAGHRPAAVARRTSRWRCCRPSSTARFELADIRVIFTPQTDLAILNYIAHHIIRTGRVNQDFVDKHTIFRRGKTDIGYGLRPEHPLQKKATGRRARPATRADMTLRRVRQVRLATTRWRRPPKLSGVPKNRLEALAELYADPKIKVMSLLDHGLQPAHPRRLVQQPRLQHPPADRQDLRARQQPVLADRPALGLRHRARGRHLLAPPAGRHGGDQPRAPRARRGDLEAAGRHDPRQARLPRRAAEPDAQGRQAQRLLGAGQQQHAGRRRTSTRRAIRATATRTTSSSSRTPIRRSPRWPPT